jgi:predicted DNA-binding transcriptional regulator AlpA
MVELDCYLSRQEVLRTLGVSANTLYAMVNRRQFPPAIPLGERRKGWSKRMVLDWQAKKRAAAEKTAA